MYRGIYFLCKILIRKEGQKKTYWKKTYIFTKLIFYFFLQPDNIGGNRGEVAMRLLLEMNHEVRGDFVKESVEQVIYTFLCRIPKSGCFN